MPARCSNRLLSDRDDRNEIVGTTRDGLLAFCWCRVSSWLQSLTPRCSATRIRCMRIGVYGATHTSQRPRHNHHNHTPRPSLFSPPFPSPPTHTNPLPLPPTELPPPPPPSLLSPPFRAHYELFCVFLCAWKAKDDRIHFTQICYI